MAWRGSKQQAPQQWRQRAALRHRHHGVSSAKISWRRKSVAATSAADAGRKHSSGAINGGGINQRRGGGVA